MLQKKPEILQEAIVLAKKFCPEPESEAALIQEIINYAAALCGKGMLPLIKGCCLTQTNPYFAYDTDATVKSAEAYIKAYNNIGVPTEKVIIKLPATYEALKAAQILKTKGIKTLGTVVHSLEQAIAAAEAGCVAISPYVDELDANIDVSLLKEYDNMEDNYGWALTRDIHYYYRAHGIKCLNIAAAMISLNTTTNLAGVDEMTIPLPCLEKLVKAPAPENFTPRLPATVSKEDAPAEQSFMNEEGKLQKAVAANKTATARISGALSTFQKFDDLTRKLVKEYL